MQQRVDEQTGKTLGPLFSRVSIAGAWRGINIIGGQWRVTKAGGRGRTKGSRVYWDRFSRRPRPAFLPPDNQDGRQQAGSSSWLLASTPGCSLHTLTNCISSFKLQPLDSFGSQCS